MVTLLTEGTASQGESLVATDLFFLDPALSSEDDDTDPLATQAADDLALMLVE
jgi:hypothetical protein